MQRSSWAYCSTDSAHSHMVWYCFIDPIICPVSGGACHRLCAPSNPPWPPPTQPASPCIPAQLFLFWARLGGRMAKPPVAAKGMNIFYWISYLYFVPYPTLTRLFVCYDCGGTVTVYLLLPASGVRRTPGVRDAPGTEAGQARARYSLPGVCVRLPPVAHKEGDI